jgi:hypothetical protein
VAGEHGPFFSEREALSTRAAREAVAAFDAGPGPGKASPGHLRILLDACKAAGVDVADFDRGGLEWLATWELARCVSFAGLIRRAYEAGKGAGHA